MIVNDLLSPQALADLKNFRASGNYNNIPDSLKEGLILLESYSGNANYAEVLYDKFLIHNPQVLARLHYLCGNLIEAEKLAQSCQDTYLLCEILISSNQIDRAFSLLRNAPFDSSWYYYAGVIYLHKGESAKAISCLERANTLFIQSQQGLPRLMALANLANAYDHAGKINKANQIFSEIILLVKSIDKKTFPRLYSKLCIDIGFHLMRTGQLLKAFRYLKNAEKIIGENRSEEFYRVKVFLGYLLKQMGYYQKAINVLADHEPNVAYLKVDRLRYLAECYTELGDFEKSYQFIARSQEAADGDKFADIFLNLIKYTNQTLQNQKSDAEKTFVYVEALCRETKDDASLAFVLGKKAYLTTDAALAKEIHDSLRQFGFNLEASECDLVIIADLVRAGNYSNALTLVDRTDFSLFSVQKIDALILKSICLLNLGQLKPAQLNLEEAKRMALARDVFLLRAKILATEIYTCTNFVNLPILYSEYHRSVQLLSSNQVTILKDHESRMIHIGTSLYSEGSCLEASQMEVAKLLSIGKYILINNTTFEVTIDGRTSGRFKQFPVQWNLLRELALAKEPVTKEKIVTNVFNRKNYSPLTDDNNVNVTLHRLRSTLKKLLGVDPIITNNGCCQIADDYKVLIIENKTIKADDKVS